MGVTFAFCDRFRIPEEPGSFSRASQCGENVRFEYLERRRDARLTQRFSVPAPNGFAHIGDALKGFLDGKKKPEDVLEGFGNVAQDVVKRTEIFLGLAKRPLRVEVSSWTPGKGDTIAVLVAVHPQRSFVEEISRVFFRSAVYSPFLEFESFCVPKWSDY